MATRLSLVAEFDGAPLSRRMALMLLCLGLPGCALWPWRKRKRAKAERVPQLVGTVTLVNAAAGFVLIDNGSQPSPPVGTILKTTTAGAESAELRVTEIRRRPFVIADIVKGAPLRDDQVFH